MGAAPLALTAVVELHLQPHLTLDLRQPVTRLPLPIVLLTLVGEHSHNQQHEHHHASSEPSPNVSDPHSLHALFSHGRGRYPHKG